MIEIKEEEEQYPLIYNTIKLHIRDGDFEYSEPPSYENLDEHQLTRFEADEFIRNGYFCVDNAVPDDIITAARRYIDKHYKKWIKQTKRQDDWRCHFNLDLTDHSKLIEHVPILNLIYKSPVVLAKVIDLIGEISGIFYSQIAFRTPLSQAMIEAQGGFENLEVYTPGADYHVDGQANSNGIRFPDHWSVMIGVALVDITTTDKGNFTVFPGSHINVDWHAYPAQKMAKSLPNLGEPAKICLKRGDIIVVHLLLGHRGGKNILSATDMSSANAKDIDSTIENIELNTREMVFIRLQTHHIDYRAPERAVAVVDNPFVEFQPMLDKFYKTSASECVKNIDTNTISNVANRVTTDDKPDYPPLITSNRSASNSLLAAELDGTENNQLKNNPSTGTDQTNSSETIIATTAALAIEKPR